MGKASFDDVNHTFVLRENPWPSLDIPIGRYTLIPGDLDAYHIRMGHPLVEQLLDVAKGKELPTAHLTFDLTSHEATIASLAPLKGQSGWIRISKIQLASARECHEDILFAGLTDSGSPLDSEQCPRLFGLGGDVGKVGVEPPADKLEAMITAQADEAFRNVERSNGNAFEEEMAKLEHWAGDCKKAMNLQIDAIEMEIKVKKGESRRSTGLTEKVKLEKEVKELEAKRNTLRKDLFNHLDEVERKKELMIDQIEEVLKLSQKTIDVMTIRWTLT